MKKLIMIVTAVAAVLSFLPMAEAGETANLGLRVTFAKNEPLVLRTEPEGPFKVQEGELLEFKVIAQDPDALTVKLEAASLPEGATFELDPIGAKDNYKRGTFKWTPKEGQGKDEPYKAEFKAKSTGARYSDYEEKDLTVSITVRVAPIIAIELNNDKWVLEKVKLGEKRGGLFDIKNTGNVPVLVDIGYGPQIQDYPSVRPGLEQGKDTFITEVVYTKPNVLPPSRWTKVLPPNKRMKLTSINPSEKEPLDLVYGAPTELSEGIKDHGVTYELRAYAEIVEE